MYTGESEFFYTTQEAGQKLQSWAESCGVTCVCVCAHVCDSCVPEATIAWLRTYAAIYGRLEAVG